MVHVRRQLRIVQERLGRLVCNGSPLEPEEQHSVGDLGRPLVGALHPGTADRVLGVGALLELGPLDAALDQLLQLGQAAEDRGEPGSIQ
ncbi:MAG: hypothetical protein V9E89_06785 [Ilumatobacteraceae bacterium]